jgi:CBS-domain-containing membrane protein
MLHYKAIEILTSENARCGRKALVDAVLEYVHGLKIAARCMVTRGIAGCYESGELATGRLEILSFNMPVRISIVVPAAESEQVVDELDGMLNDGILSLHDLNVLSHRTQNTFFPRQLMVRDVMTVEPKTVGPDTPLDEAAELLLSSVFTGLPVVDKHNRPIGVLTQGDLIRKGGLPLRLGLLAESGQNRRKTLLKQIASRRAVEVMSSPAALIDEDKLLTEAVELMLDKGVKRLPVVNGKGRLSGIVSRLDIFRTVMRETPDWNAFTNQQIHVGAIKRVGDILRRDVHTVSTETTVSEVIRVIDHNDIQRVAVVDAEGKLLGLISDRDLLRYFKPAHKGIWNLLAKVKGVFEQEEGTDFQQRIHETTAGEVMNTKLTTVQNDMLIEEAITLMIDKGLKRLPVIDSDDRFQGMISRDSLLRIGFTRSDKIETKFQGDVTQDKVTGAQTGSGSSDNR